MYLGLDIGGTNLKIGLIDKSNELIYQATQRANSDSGKDDFLEQIISFIKEIKSKYSQIETIGIGVPGVVNHDIVRVAPNLNGWKDIPLKKIVSQHINIPIAIDNDANVAAIAELEFGSGSDYDDFIYVTLGTGVGGAIVYNKHIFKGSSGAAGEIGHTIINIKDTNNSALASFRLGTLEEYAGRKQIIQLAKNILKKYPDSILNSSNFDVKDISEAVYLNDLAAKKCLNKVGQYLGIAIASSMNLLDISTVIIGGGISNAHPILFSKVLDTIKLRAIPTIAERVELKLARFNKDAGIIGAALIGKKLIIE